MGMVSDDKTIQTSVARITRTLDLRQPTIWMTNRDTITVEEVLEICDKEWWPTKSLDPPKPLEAYEIMRWKITVDLMKRLFETHEEFIRLLKRIYELEQQKETTETTTVSQEEDCNPILRNCDQSQQNMTTGQTLFKPEQNTKITGYCMRCKKKRTMNNIIIEKDKKGKKMKGQCTICGAKISRTIPRGTN